MSNEREMLEYAAKACGYELDWYPSTRCDLVTKRSVGEVVKLDWNPITSSADCAEMCAKLEINHEHHSDYIQCLWAPQETYHVITMLKDHDNSRLNAWMYAATMVAAKTQGYEA